MIKENKRSIVRAALAGVLAVLLTGLTSCGGCAPESVHHAGPFCGNAVCDFGENCTVCPNDCGPCAGCALPDFALVCGGFDDFNTTGRGDFLNTYTCAGWAGVNESGSDVVYQINTPFTCDLTAILSNMSADLDVFILDDIAGQGCADQCLAAGDFWTALPAALPGKYDIAVDGFAGAEGTYSLDVFCSNCPDGTCDGVEGCDTCPADCGTCPACVAPDFVLPVGGSDTFTTVGGTNLLNSYTCVQSLRWNESGPDYIYQVTIAGGCDLTATLTGLVNDLDVFILAENAGVACVEQCLAPGNNQAVYPAAPAGNYDVVVDGFQGAAGPYTLTVTCP